MFQCVLFDCAGLIPSPDNVLDELAQRAAIEALQRCSAVLFCVDSAKTDWSEDLAIRTLIQPKSVIYVATKSDLWPQTTPAAKMQELAGTVRSRVSVCVRDGGTRSQDSSQRSSTPFVVAGATHASPAQRRQRLTASLQAKTPAPGVALTARHRQAVTEAVESVRQAIAEVKQGREEVAVMMIRAACEAISGLSQQHLDEQVLDRIFSRFCVGK